MAKTTEKGIDRLYGYLRRFTVIVVVPGYLIHLVWPIQDEFWSFELNYYYDNLLDAALLIGFGVAALFGCRRIKGWFCLIPLLAAGILTYLTAGLIHDKLMVPTGYSGQWISPTRHWFWGFNSGMQALSFKVLRAFVVALAAWGIACTLFSGDPHRHILRRRRAQTPGAKRIDKNICPHCQYDLRENTSGKCPECGKVTPGRINELIEIRQELATAPAREFAESAGDIS